MIRILGSYLVDISKQNSGQKFEKKSPKMPHAPYYAILYAQSPQSLVHIIEI